MRLQVVIPLAVVVSVSFFVASPRATDCEAVDGIEFICDQSGPEDLAAIPDSPWVIASSREANNGGLRLIDRRDHTTTILLRSETPRERLDRTTYDSCPGPIVSIEKEQFSSHGLYLQPGEGKQHTLYVVHHGTRESVEVFEVNANITPPQLTWVGCAVAPDDNLSLNSVVGLPGGGFAATSFRMLDMPFADLQAGAISGAVWEWQSGKGWHEVPGTETAGPNGLEVSEDGAWLYIGGWGRSAFIRVSRGQDPVVRDDVPIGFRIDNLRQGPDGSILATGQAGIGGKQTSNVAVVNPRTLEFEEIIQYDDNDIFKSATTALAVNDEFWVGSFQGDRIARFSSRGVR